MKVLLVEDVATLGATARALRRHGYTVVAAGSRLEASAVQGAFDRMVCDIRLGDGDGIEFAQHMSERGVVGRVVFFTSAVEPHVRALAEEVGALVTRAEGVAKLAHALTPQRPRLESGLRIAADASKWRGDGTTGQS